MPDVVKQTTSDSSDELANTSATAAVAPNSATTNNTVAQSEAESRLEKIRRAKIAMEGFERTVRREADEKEEEASEEKQKYNKLLLSIYHEKELLELTWVNLDDKRTSLKKILEPILSQEDAIQAEENQIESKEDVTVDPKAKHEVELIRWQIQEKRKRAEEEKWLVEEKISKIEEQIIDLKKKYQTLLAQEDDIHAKIQALDEQLLLQQEVLRQQHDLEEQKKKQEALRQVEEQKKAEEAEKRRLEEIKKAEEDKKKAEQEKESALKQQEENAKKDAAKKIEELRRIEEEKQRQETARQRSEQARADELKQRLSEMMARPREETEKEGEVPVPIPPNQTNQSINEPETKEVIPTTEVGLSNELKEKQDAIRRALELERVRRENQEAEMMREMQAKASKSELIDKLRIEGGEIRPLRTLKGDLADAIKNQEVSSEDVDRASKKIFPWLNP